MTKPIAYIFPQTVTRVYEKTVVTAVHIRDKGGPNEHEEVQIDKLGWVMVIGTTGYLVPDKPDYAVGEEVEVVIRPSWKLLNEREAKA